MRRSVVWTELDSLLDLGFCASEIPVFLQTQNAKHRVSLAHVGLEFEGSGSRGNSALHTFFFVDTRDARDITLGHSDIGERVIWVQ